MRPEQALRRFEEFLRGKGLRVTRPRAEVLRLTWSTHRHFSAEELYGWAREQDLGLSRATVYRTLGLLVEGGFLSGMDGGQGQMLYEHILGHTHHDHMICLSCGRILEFRCAEIERLQEEQARKHRFHMVDHSLRIEGYCSRCADQAPEEMQEHEGER